MYVLNYSVMCFVELKACASSPCLNWGTCSNEPFYQYKCSCAPGFTGSNCETGKLIRQCCFKYYHKA